MSFRVPQYGLVGKFKPFVSPNGGSMGGGMIGFKRTEFNTLIYAAAIRNLNPELRYFNTFAPMQLTSSGQFNITQLKSSPLLLKAQTADCAWSPTNPYSNVKRLITPHAVQAPVEICYEAELATWFDTVVRYWTSGMQTQPAGINEAISLLAESYADSLVTSYHLVCSAAGLYATSGGGAPTFAAGVSAGQQTAYVAQMNSGQGYVAHLRENANVFPNYNVTSALAANEISSTTRLITIDPSLVFQRLYDAASPPLKQGITNGAMTVNGQTYAPQIVVDAKIYERWVQVYWTRANDPAKQDRELVMRDVVIDGMTRRVLYFRNIPVILDPYITGHDQFVNANTHFMAITMSNVITRGTAVGDLSETIDRDLPVRIYRNPADPAMDDVVRMQSKGLYASVISDPELIVAVQRQTVWTP